jgi:two-component system, NtrC family, sensor kinase
VRQISDTLAHAGRLQSLKALAFVAALAPSIVFATYALISYDAAFRSAEARASHFTSILQDHCQRLFETVELALANANQLLDDVDEDAIRTSPSLWGKVVSVQKLAPQVGSLFLVQADGSLLLTTRAFPPPPENFSDRDYFLAHKNSDAGFFIGKAYVGRISNIPIFNFAIRRDSKDGGFKGVIGSSAFVDYFHEFYATVGESEDDYSVILLRTDGELLARYPTFTVGDRLDPRVIRSIDSQSQKVDYATSPLDGANRLFASARVGQYPAYVTYSIKQEAILRQWAKALVVPGAAALTATILVLSLTSFAFRRARREQAAIQQLRKTAISLHQEIERRNRAEASLLQAQKLEAMGQLTGGIAHDFNNLLTIISGNLALVRARIELPAVQRMVAAAEYAAKRGAELTAQMLAFSRAQRLRPSALDVKILLDSARSWLARAVTESIELQVDCDPGIWPVRADISQLEAALLNLVINARDAMEGRGKLILQARNLTVLPEEPCGRAIKPGHYVALSVTDNGKGMSAEVLAKAYEPFFTTKAIGKGSGLGLSQVHGFARQSGGDICIESTIGRGTTVTLFLPRSDVAPATENQPQISLSVEQPSEKVILIVEDDDEVRKVSAALIQELGFITILARSGREALAILSAGERIDILFTDVLLPSGMDGKVLAASATKVKPGLKVLLTTASISVHSTFPILHKPFTKPSLAEALANLCNHNSIRREPADDT